MSDTGYKNTAEREYTDAGRLMAGLYAIEHLIDNYASSLPVGNAYDKLLEAVRAEYQRARDRNLAENGWVFEEALSPLINPVFTDPGRRRAVVVAVVNAEEADLEIATVGPFPMVVEGHDGEASRTVRSEEELVRHFEDIHGGAVTTIRPMPFASRRSSEPDTTGSPERDV